MKRLLAAAAMEERFRKEERSAWLDERLREARRPRLLAVQDVANRTVRCAGGEAEESRMRFRLLLLRRAYPLAEWLPPRAVMSLARVDIDPQGRFVLLTLRTGTQLLDTGDRITVRGHADDVAISELVACCARRGWTRVDVAGDEAFRVAASRELLRRGIDVVDCPLSGEEAALLRLAFASERGQVAAQEKLRAEAGLIMAVATGERSLAAGPRL